MYHHTAAVRNCLCSLVSSAVTVLAYMTEMAHATGPALYGHRAPGVYNILFLHNWSVGTLTRFNKIAIQGSPQMAVDKKDNSLSRVYSYYPKCNLPLFYV